jgi:hypothetical protein
MDQIELKTIKLLLVEGHDDQNFFQKLIEDIGLEGIQIITMNGKKNFGVPNFKSVINAPGFREVKSLGIALDADENANNTFSSICTVLRECGLPVPTQPMEIIGVNLKVGVLVIPPGAEQGEIEDLCLAAIKEYNELECIENYFSCLKEKLPLDKFPKDLSKAKVQAFLASREKSVPHLGVAALKGYLPFDQEVFREVKNFLKAL